MDRFAEITQKTKQVLELAKKLYGVEINPSISYTLRDRKLGHLDALEPQAILSANVGCITHLQSGTGVPVRHWVEVVE